MRTCVVCGVGIEGRDHQSITCGRACRLQVLYARRRNKRAAEAAALPTRACSLPGCCKPIIGRRSDAKYCSVRCREKSKFVRRPELRAIAVEHATRWKNANPERYRAWQRERWATNAEYREYHRQKHRRYRAEAMAALKLIREIEAKGLEALL